MEVELVALQANRRLIRRQKIVGDRAVRRVAQAAVFDNRRVLEDERAFLALVAGVAEIVEPHVGIELAFGCRVRIVAADTAHMALRHRVVRRQLELSEDRLVAVLAAVQRVRRLVDRVAVEAAHVLHRVRRRVPLALFLEPVALETRGGVLNRVAEGPDQRRISLLHMLGTVSVAALTTHSAPVDLERLDAHVDLVGHRRSDVVMTVHAGAVRGRCREGQGAHHADQSQQDAPPHVYSSLFQRVFSIQTNRPPSGVANTTSWGLVESSRSKRLAVRPGRLLWLQRYGARVQFVLTVTSL